MFSINYANFDISVVSLKAHTHSKRFAANYCRRPIAVGQLDWCANIKHV